MKTGLIQDIAMCLLAVAMLAGFTTPAACQTAPDTAIEHGIALLPIANYSGETEATEKIIPVIIETLKNSGIGIIAPDELRPVLREHRIRAVGMISQSGAEAIASDLGVAYLLVGSVDFYRSGDDPAVGISMHLISVPEMKPFWAVSVYAAGDESIGLLGLGGIMRADSLATHLTTKIAGQIDDAINGKISDRIDNGSPLIAIVPFDDIDSYQPIGAVASTYLLTRLVHDGMRVVEPGVTREIFLDNNRAPRGEIDHELIDALRDSLEVDLIITGAVDEFSITAAGTGGSKADISLGARLIDASSHRIESAHYVIKQNETGSGLLSGGSNYPPAEVVMEAIRDVVRKFSISSPQAATDSR